MRMVNVDTEIYTRKWSFLRITIFCNIQNTFKWGAGDVWPPISRRQDWALWSRLSSKTLPLKPRQGKGLWDFGKHAMTWSWSGNVSGKKLEEMMWSSFMPVITNRKPLPGFYLEVKVVFICTFHRMLWLTHNNSFTKCDLLLSHCHLTRSIVFVFLHLFNGLTCWMMYEWTMFYCVCCSLCKWISVNLSGLIILKQYHSPNHPQTTPTAWSTERETNFCVHVLLLKWG